MRAAAEVLLWLAAVAGVLWLMVLVELLGGTEDTAAEGYAPVADGLRPLAAGLAPGLLGAAGLALGSSRRTPRRARAAAVLAGVLLVAAGFGFRLIEDIDLELQQAYVVVPCAAGVLLVLVAATPWSGDVDPAPRPGVAGVGAAVVPAGLFALSVVFLVGLQSWGWVATWEEEQPAWDYGLPTALVLVGSLAATVHAMRRRWAVLAGAVMLTALGFGAGCWAAYVAI